MGTALIQGEPVPQKEQHGTPSTQVDTFFVHIYGYTHKKMFIFFLMRLPNFA